MSRQGRRDAAAGQLPLDFETPLREAFAQLEGAFCVLAASDAAADRACTGVRLLCKDLMGLTFGGAPVNWTIAEFAEKYGKSPSRIRQIIAKAERLGLITRNQRRIHRGGQASNHLAINLAGIREISSRPRNQAKRPQQPPRAAGNEISLGAQQNLMGRPMRSHGPNKETSTLNPQLPPQPPGRDGCDEPPRSTDRSGGWGEVLEELRAIGMAKPAAALAAAQAAEASPADAWQLIEHYRACPGAWTPGALYVRLQRLRPGDDPAAGWPDPSPAWQEQEQQRRRASDDARREAWRAQCRAAAAAADAERAARADLAARYGAAVDALGDREFRELLAGDPLARRQPIAKLRAGFWRHEAIAALAAREETASC